MIGRGRITLGSLLFDLAVCLGVLIGLLVHSCFLKGVVP